MADNSLNPIAEEKNYNPGGGLAGDSTSIGGQNDSFFAPTNKKNTTVLSQANLITDNDAYQQRANQVLQRGAPMSMSRQQYRRRNVVSAHPSRPRVTASGGAQRQFTVSTVTL